MRGQAGVASVASLALLMAVSAVCCFSSDSDENSGLRYVQPDATSGGARSLPVIVAPEGRRIYIAAQTGVDGKGDLKAQTRRAIANLKTALGAAGATAADLVRLDINLLKTEDPDAVRKILLESFPPLDLRTR